MRSPHTPWPLACALLLFVGCASPQAPDTTEEARAAIDIANAAFMAGISAGDAAAVAALFTDDAQQFPPNSPMITGREAIQEALQNVINGGFNLQLEAVEVEGHGDTAHEVGKYTMIFDGESVDEGKYIVIWKKVDGQWQLHRDIFNSNNPPPPPAPEAPADESAM